MLTRFLPLPPRLAQLWIVAMASALFLLAASYFLEAGSSSTDENLFTTPPSAVYLAASLRVTPAAGAVVPPATPVDTLLPGDIITAVEGERVTTVDDLRARILGLPAGTRVAVRATRAAEGAFVAGLAEAGALATVAVRDIGRGALVIGVTAGGASDRAGMKVGDVIIRIAGEEFSTIFEADARMRSGGPGRAYTYDVIRDGREVSLHVTLARFGLQIVVFVAMLTGLALMAFGTWIGLVRTQFLGARWLAYTLIPFGYAVATLFGAQGQLGTQSALPAARTLALIGGAVCGLAGTFWSAAHFPVGWPRLQHAKWVGVVLYGLGAASFVAVIAGLDTLGLVVGLAAIAIFGTGVHVAWRSSRPAEYVKMTHARRIAAVGVITALALFVMRLLGRGALQTPLGDASAWLLPLLLLIPASHLYTIAEYRLFDLDLRVRRNVQYSLMSLGWGAAMVAMLLLVLWTLPRLPLPTPSIRMTSRSIEFDADAGDAPSRAAFEKGLLMAMAIVAAFGLRTVGIRGQRWLAERFDRGEYDYRRASQLVGEAMATRLDLEGLADGVVATLGVLMPVKRAAVFFAHKARVHWGRTPEGFDADAWNAFCSHAPTDLLDQLRHSTRTLRTAYAAPRLRRALEAIEIEVIYPIRVNDTLMGGLLVGEKRSESPLHAADFEFLSAIGQQVAPAIENAFLYEDLRGQERLRHELQIARQIQVQSLPQEIPQIAGLDIAGSSVPAFEVGGDYFDYLNGQPDHFTVMVGDVSGKGTSAALYMSKLQGIVRSLHDFGLGPTELFVRTNWLLGRDMERRSFVTALGGFFNTSQRQLVVARAGHLPLFHYSRVTGTIDRILPGGLGFGLSTRPLFERELEEQRRTYQPGDVFLFVTDGITECQDERHDLFGEERLEALLADSAGAGTSAEGIRARIAQAVHDFSASPDAPDDDQTIVVVRAIEG